MEATAIVVGGSGEGVDAVCEAVNQLFSEELAEFACEDIRAKAQAAHTGAPTSSVFPASAFERLLGSTSSSSNDTRTNTQHQLCVTAAAEYLCAEVLEMAGNQVQKTTMGIKPF